jgi:hypothetical protein
MLIDRLGAMRTWLRPLNLIVIQQGLWPLLVLLGDGPRVTEPAGLPWDWWGVRIAAPVIAAVLAWVYVRRGPQLDDDGSGGVHGTNTRRVPAVLTGRSPSGTEDGPVGAPSVRMQAQFALIGLPIMVAVVRLVDGPVGYATKIAAFGAVDALAFQLISFGVAYRLFPDARRGTLAAVGFFALSWAMRDLILAIVGDSLGSIFFTIVGGLLAGALVALCSLVIRRWPGGFWPAWGAQWLIISLIIGFT